MATNAIRPTLRGCALLALAHGLDRKTFLAIAADCFAETLNEIRRLQPPRWPTKIQLPKRSRTHKRDWRHAGSDWRRAKKRS